MTSDCLSARQIEKYVYDGCELMKFVFLLAKVHIAPNLVTPSPYKPLHFVLDGGCDDGVDHGAGRCPSCSKSHDTAPLIGLILCSIRWL